MKAILVGAGGVGRELLKRLGDMWEVTVVDLSAERLARAGYIRSVRKLTGDGSSRLVLERAGLADADALIAATGDDEANLEALRIAREAGIKRLVAAARTPERVASYRELGVSAEAPHTLAARRIELSLESRRMSSMAFADGRAEAIEFRIEHDSPVCGKALRELAASAWIVGAVLRRGELIVPHGDTVLTPGDLVTVVGRGADFAEIVRSFSSGEERFPLGFGKRVAVAVEAMRDVEGPFAEAVHLVRNSRASALLIVHRDLDALRDDTRAGRVREALDAAREMAEGVELRFRAVEGRPERALAELPAGESVGVLVVAGLGRGVERRAEVRRALSLMRRARRPVLLSRGTQPYRAVAVPARRSDVARGAVRAAIDLARAGGTRLVALAVLDPHFFSGGAGAGEARADIAWLEEEAAVQGVSVRAEAREGNPVRLFEGLAAEADLLVLGRGSERGVPLIRTDLGALIARRFARSLLFVPVAPES